MPNFIMSYLDPRVTLTPGAAGSQFWALMYVLVIFAGRSGMTDDVAVADIQRFEKGLIEFVRTRFGSLLTQIVQKKQITDEARPELKRAIVEYKEQFQASAAAVRV